MSSAPISKGRQKPRDSLFLSAEVSVATGLKPVVVRVRNLSAGGMMVDSNAIFHKGAIVSAKLRGIGSVSGEIAWVIDERAGISFDKEIDPKEARAPVSAPKPIVLLPPHSPRARRPGLKIP